MSSHQRRWWWLAIPAVLAGCPPPPAPGTCKRVEQVAHVDPLPKSGAPAEFLYTEVAAKDGIAYLGTESHGVLVIDPAAGAEIARLDDGAYINSVAMAGSFLVYAPDEGIVVHDISDARSPSGRAAYQSDTLPSCHTVFMHRDIVYCSTALIFGAPHVVMARVTRPASPGDPLVVTEVGRYTIPFTFDDLQTATILVHDLFVHERGGRTLAYLAYWEKGLQILDVTNPAQPVLLGGYPVQAWTHSVWVDGNYAYVGEESWRGPIRVYDVSDVSNPRPIGVMQSRRGEAGDAHNVQVHNGYVYASWYQDGLRVFEARGIANVEQVAFFNTWDEADNRANPASTFSRYAGNWDVFVDPEGLIYLADMQRGLFVVKHDPSQPACTERFSGTSAFSKQGRAPFGFSTPRPAAIRRGRTVPFQVAVVSVDTYFEMDDQTALSTHPFMQLDRGVPADDLRPGPFIGFGWVQRAWKIGLDEPLGDATLTVTLNDEGEERRIVRAVPILDAAPPNTDTEPNDHFGVGAKLVPESSGGVLASGTVTRVDRLDFFLIERPAGAPAFTLHVAVPAGPAGGTSPAARVSLNTTGSNTGNQYFRTFEPNSDPSHPELMVNVRIAGPSGPGTFHLVVNNDQLLESVPYQVRMTTP
jgi:hypothetical protein